MTDDAIPEADRAEGAPHPRETARLFGHEAAEAAFLDAVASGRLHHAWLVTGPRGVGKATLAWRMARFLLTRPRAGNAGEVPAPASMDVPPDHPVARRMAALSEPGCLLIRRAWDAERKRLRSQITVDEVRRLGSFFGLRATDGGARVVIVDSADEMNPQAANALLKVLEEPPAGAVLFLVSHQPARLLPTIRSRCRTLRLAPLGPDALAAALGAAGHVPGDSAALGELAGGSAGEAIRLLSEGGTETYARLVAILARAPRMDRPEAIAFAEAAAERGHEARLDLAVRMIDLALGRLARTAAGHPPATEAAEGERAMLMRLAEGAGAAGKWAGLQQEVSGRIAHGRAVNIDPASLVLDALLKIDEAAAGSPPRP